jgi:hypothetical protein
MYQQKSDLLSIDTVLVNVEDRDAQVFVQDNLGNKYSFFKQKTNNGGPTAAAISFEGYQIGQPITVIYKEVPYKNQTIKSIVKFRPTDENSAPAKPSIPNTINPVGNGPVGNSTPRFTSPMSDKDTMIGVLALAKSLAEAGQLRLADLEVTQTWQRLVNAYRTGEAVISGVEATDVNSTSSDNINVEDIPF